MSEAQVTDVGQRPMMVLDDVHVTYRVYASGKRMSARDSVLSLNALRGGRSLKTIPALRGVTFTASAGETIGVVGHNGSGKSTLFRAMTGLIPTAQGRIYAADRPVLLGVNAALVPALSGENNIKLGLLAMGFSAQEAAAQVDEIADFAELNDFIHHPMRTYSSGMGARLRFAIASAKAHSILLIDEALAVGDRRFKMKSERRINELRESAGLVMIVSHSVGSLRDTCERVLWIHQGELRADGPAKDVIAEYTKWTKQPGRGAVGAASTAKTKAGAHGAKGKSATPRSAASSVAAPVAAASTEMTKPVELPPAEQLLQLIADVPVAEKPVVAETTTTGFTARTHAGDVARRQRYRTATRQKARQRAIRAGITGGALILAVGAGAALALAANLLVPVDDVASITSPTSTASSAAAADTTALIRSFGVNTTTASCATPEGAAKIQLSWAVENATSVAVSAGAPDAGAARGKALLTRLPAQQKVQSVNFPCSKEAWSYTLTAGGANGDEVTSVVTVKRKLAPVEPTPAPQQPGQTQPQQPSQPQQPAPSPSAPSPSAPSQPSSQPAPSPAPSELAPSTEPSAPAQPSPEPSQSETPQPPDSPAPVDPGTADGTAGQ